jgi:4-hydroxy-tetrahydrodipicolinate reductase
MIKIALVGYGKMGKEIESVMDSKELKLVGKYDIDNTIQNHMKEIPDVAIEFSTPISMMQNLEYLASKKVNIVCGTTGWYDDLYKVERIVEKEGIGFIYTSNFSIGVNIYFQLIREAGKIIDKFRNYDLAIEETHHNQKIDKPSGTALKMGEVLLSTIKRKNKLLKPGSLEKLDSGMIGISSTRVGNIIGKHKLILDSMGDMITIEHDAKTRRGFAEGALLAAKFIHGKKGVFKFEDIFINLMV